MRAGAFACLGMVLTLLLGVACSEQQPAQVLREAGDQAFQRGDYDEAEEKLRAAWEQEEQGDPHALSSDSSDPADSALLLLAQLYRAQDRLDEAEQMYLRWIERAEATLGPEHPAAVSALSQLSSLYVAQGRNDEAELLIRRVLALTGSAPESDPSERLANLDRLAALSLEQRRYAEAERHLREALALVEERFGPEDRQAGITLQNLADVVRAQRRYDEAASLYERAAEILEAELGPEDPEVIQLARSYDSLLREIERDEADSARADRRETAP